MTGALFANICMLLWGAWMIGVMAGMRGSGLLGWLVPLVVWIALFWVAA